MNQEVKEPTNPQKKFDPISVEFRQIIDDHIQLVKFIDQDDLMDFDKQEKKEEANRQNLNVVAYGIAFLIYRFDDVDSKVLNSNLTWVAKRIVKAISLTDRGRRIDKSLYYFLREMVRDYLKNINSELTRIDDRPVDVWQHSYNAFDAKLKQVGIPADF